MIIKPVKAKSALSKCGFEEGSYCLNPYTGCGHACEYCYARFMKRFTGHKEKWGTFVDAKENIAELLKDQLAKDRYRGKTIFVSTVTDPYQPAEDKFELTRACLKVLVNHNNPVAILTKSDTLLRDLDLIKQLDDVEVSITVNTLDKHWKDLVEPESPSVEQRLRMAKKLTENGVRVSFMMGPYWPFFTDAEALFKKFKEAGASRVFTESFNTTGSNWAGVEKAAKKHYPAKVRDMKDILFDKDKFRKFYRAEKQKINKLSKKYGLPVTFKFER